MSVILSAYTKNAFKEYVLPNIDNTNYKIVLRAVYSGHLRTQRLISI